MTYAAHLAVDLQAVPESARAEIRRVMGQIAEALDSVAPSNPFWASVRNSHLVIDVAGFRLVYRIDVARDQVIALELSPLRAR